MLTTSKPIILRIQPSDMLAIVVSSLSEESNTIFNSLNSSSSATSQGGSNNDSQSVGYAVDLDGKVTLPLVGKIKLGGRTIEEASVFIKDQLARYIKEPAVHVRILNHKFTVIGEVNRPGIYNLTDNPITLPEVIGLVGELTVYGKRNSIKLIRTINNKREIVNIDLTSAQIFDSPYYFIENNDVVYVESYTGKYTSANRSLQVLPVALSITSTVLILFSFLK